MNGSLFSPSISKRRAISIDYGHARIGMAISDSTWTIAQPIPTIQGNKKPLQAAKNVCQAVVDLEKAKQITIDTAVIGLPLHMNGTESERSGEVRQFSEAIKTLLPQIHIVLFDERFTSLQAERAMKEMPSMSRKDRAKKVDSVSSLILLQSYLDNLQFQKDK